MPTAGGQSVCVCMYVWRGVQQRLVALFLTPFPPDITNMRPRGSCYAQTERENMLKKTRRRTEQNVARDAFGCVSQRVCTRRFNSCQDWTSKRLMTTSSCQLKGQKNIGTGSCFWPRKCVFTHTTGVLTTGVNVKKILSTGGSVLGRLVRLIIHK